MLLSSPQDQAKLRLCGDLTLTWLLPSPPSAFPHHLLLPNLQGDPRSSLPLMFFVCCSSLLLCVRLLWVASGWWKMQ